RRRHTRFSRDWSSDVCSSDLTWQGRPPQAAGTGQRWRTTSGVGKLPGHRPGSSSGRCSRGTAHSPGDHHFTETAVQVEPRTSRTCGQRKTEPKTIRRTITLAKRTELPRARAGPEMSAAPVAHPPRNDGGAHRVAERARTGIEFPSGHRGA